MVISTDNIKKLRDDTACGIMECKRALEETHGDMDKAKQLLQKRGAELAAKKSDRAAKEGRVEAYVHMGNKIAVLVEVNSETDFVAKNEMFCTFAKDVAMHIAAMAPQYIRREDVPADALVKIADPEMFFKQNCLMEQAFIKDSSKTIQDYLNLLVAQFRENIFIGRFIRYKVGESQ